MPRKPHTRTTRFRNISVTWRVTTSKVAGFGAFGDAVRFGVEIVSVDERTKVA